MVAGREGVTHRVEAQGALYEPRNCGDRFSPVQHASLAVPRCAAPCHSCHVMVCNFSNDGSALSGLFRGQLAAAPRATCNTPVLMDSDTKRPCSR